MFDKIKQWAQLPLKTRYNILIGAIIVVMGSVIFLQYKEKINLRYEHSVSISNCNSRLDIITGFYEKKVEACNQDFFEYLKKNEEEIRKLLYDTKQLNKKHENIN